MKIQTLGIVTVLFVAGCGRSADAQLAVTAPVQAAQKVPDDPVQMKATLIKLQVQVLERDREIGALRAQVAELQLNALGAAVQTMDPAVRKALGLDQKPVTPQTPPKP